MLFYLGPIVLTLLGFFIAVSTFERGKFADAIGSGLIIGFLSCIIFMGAVPVAWTSGEQAVSNGPVDGRVLVSQNNNSYIFESNGKTVTLDGDVELFANADSNYYQKMCEVTPDWAAPFDYGSCNYRIFIKE